VRSFMNAAFVHVGFNHAKFFFAISRVNTTCEVLNKM